MRLQDCIGSVVQWIFKVLANLLQFEFDLSVRSSVEFDFDVQWCLSPYIY